ncbi:hypothetical protein [Turicibacter sp. HGF1]|uniref:hypothetical protein n=1 Tax=Turicibacter sp. HGF1 TaxID=910310 RepID=UPI000587CFE5|nr:hypothetical protein [Turicibacter sp. HGF1]
MKKLSIIGLLSTMCLLVFINIIPMENELGKSYQLCKAEYYDIIIKVNRNEMTKSEAYEYLSLIGIPSEFLKPFE